MIEVKPDETEQGKRRYKERAKRTEMTVREQRLLNNMKTFARGNLVTASFADLMEGVASSPTAVSPVMGHLLAMGVVEVVDRPGGRAKTTYRIAGMDPAPLAEVVTDEQGAAPESCASCHFLHRSRALASHHCRRNPPTMGGFPPTKPESWCGEYRKAAIK